MHMFTCNACCSKILITPPFLRETCTKFLEKLSVGRSLTHLLYNLLFGVLFALPNVTIHFQVKYITSIKLLTVQSVKH